MPLICGDFFSEILDTAGLNNDESKSLLKSLSYAKCFLQWKWWYRKKGDVVVYISHPRNTSLLVVEEWSSHTEESQLKWNLDSVSGMVMFLLSLQTGLIDLKMPQRLGAMTIILFIVAASLLQTLLEVKRSFYFILTKNGQELNCKHLWTGQTIKLISF